MGDGFRFALGVLFRQLFSWLPRAIQRPRLPVLKVPAAKCAHARQPVALPVFRLPCSFASKKLRPKSKG